ncbi:beta-N-acetylhexosaminidase [Candidatus Symbiobacter mobilis CR]|uniref:Beta-hexosaminidase n=1 Tax=Candidatus Symbiobacter mobilis CR TaxID=946483 RepID=U5NE83_9BURK|nr:beta-N-acetylhexosaminidase [Candidatus Symbiobacter mobilis CR]
MLIDLPGCALCAADRDRLAHPFVGGVVLFARNWRDRTQLTALCADIKSVRNDLLICVDHEGGRVQRFASDGFTPLPPMRVLGQRWEVDPNAGAALATACGFVMATELRACGVDLSFAPVLDLDYGASTVIGDRAFHANANTVTALASALMHGMQLGGMANCGKHFPGHGHVRGDSHTEVPVDSRTLEQILEQDAQPYGHLCLRLQSVMPAHVVYPAVDGVPAGFSARWLQGILRERLCFGGAIFSDDLSMVGARVVAGQPIGVGRAAELAWKAGCDMVLLCNPATSQDFDACLVALERSCSQATPQRKQDSEARRHSLLPIAPALGWDALQSDGRYVHACKTVARVQIRV